MFGGAGRRSWPTPARKASGRVAAGRATGRRARRIRHRAGRAPITAPSASVPAPITAPSASVLAPITAPQATSIAPITAPSAAVPAARSPVVASNTPPAIRLSRGVQKVGRSPPT
jgi:hypothetical protein